MERKVLLLVDYGQEPWLEPVTDTDAGRQSASLERRELVLIEGVWEPSQAGLQSLGLGAASQAQGWTRRPRPRRGSVGFLGWVGLGGPCVAKESCCSACVGLCVCQLQPGVLMLGRPLPITAGRNPLLRHSL